LGYAQDLKLFMFTYFLYVYDYVFLIRLASIKALSKQENVFMWYYRAFEDKS